VIAISQGNALLGKLRKMRTDGDDDEDIAPRASKQGGTTQQPLWMKSLLQHCTSWLTSLPERLASPQARSADGHDPMFRLFARETSVGQKLLVQVRKDLADVIKVCDGVLKQTNHLRSLMSHLNKGTIPTLDPLQGPEEHGRRSMDP